MVTIRQILVEEVELSRQIRLMSLKDAPYAFSSAYESALERSAESWREQVERSAQGRDRVTLIALSEDVPIGVAALYRLEGQVNTGELLQVWVSPEYRGTGPARDLMDAIFIWARDNSFHRIIAGIRKGNDRALTFYTNYGFSVIDKALPDDFEAVSLIKEVK